MLTIARQLKSGLAPTKKRPHAGDRGKINQEVSEAELKELCHILGLSLADAPAPAPKAITTSADENRVSDGLCRQLASSVNTLIQTGYPVSLGGLQDFCTSWNPHRGEHCRVAMLGVSIAWSASQS